MTKRPDFLLVRRDDLRDGFAALLGAEKMLADAIEMKTARQIERIERGL